MDPFDELLRGLRADGAGVRRTELTGPWALELDELTLSTPLRGEGTINGQAVRVGDTVIARNAVLRGERDAVVLRGTYRVAGEVGRRLVRVLPPVIVVPCYGDHSALQQVLDSTAFDDSVVTDRLLDWLMVCTLRSWADRNTTEGWLQAAGDDVVGPVLKAMHDDPARPWTLVSLAKEAGVSRTTLAGRFAKLVGAPPLTYLTDWRMAVAADLLASSTATVASVARQVGYADAFGFSSAFKRVHGVSPTECRTGC